MPARVFVARRRGADGVGFDVVVVDVDRHPAVGLVVAAAVLADAVPGPGAGRQVGVGGAGAAVPVGGPDVVGLEVGSADPVDEVGDAGGAAAVDAGLVAERVQAGGPGGEEGQRRGAGRAAGRVALHVEVDRAAGADRDRPRVFDRVVGRRRALEGRGGGAQLGARPAAAGRRLQADVGRDQVPAGSDLFGDPARRQVGLRAAAVAAADVDADGAIGRASPGRHFAPRGGGAGVEAEPGEARGGGDVGGRDAARPRALARGAGAGAGIDEDRPPPPDRAGRAVLARARAAQVDGTAVEPHAGVRVLGEPDHRPALGHADRVTSKVNSPGIGARGHEHGQRHQAED